MSTGHGFTDEQVAVVAEAMYLSTAINDIHREALADIWHRRNGRENYYPSGELDSLKEEMNTWTDVPADLRRAAGQLDLFGDMA